MQLAQADNIGSALAPVVKAVVGHGHAFVSRDHQYRTVIVISLSCSIKYRIGLESLREGKGGEHISRIVCKSIYSSARSSEATTPYLMWSTLQAGKWC